MKLILKIEKVSFILIKLSLNFNIKVNKIKFNITNYNSCNYFLSNWKEDRKTIIVSKN